MIKPFCSKKYFSIIAVLLFSLLSSQKKFTIVLDAGHGGSDHGAARSYESTGYIAEKDITLSVALQIGKMLEKNKDYKIIYTRKTDIYPSLTERTNLANRSKADLFISVHVNANKKTSPFGTETFVQGPDQNRTNLEVAKAENDVIFLDAQDRETFASYDPTSPESLIALKVQQSKYLESSLILGGLIEENFTNRAKRFSRGVKQQNLHVLRMNAMPSVLIEIGFISNEEEALYLISDEGQKEISESIYHAIINYKKIYDKKTGNTLKNKDPEKPKEQPLKNDFRILLMSTPIKYNFGDPIFKGLNNILIIKENTTYKYYYSVSNYASIRDANIKTAKDAGFKNSLAVGFIPNQILNNYIYTLEVYLGKEKLKDDSYILKNLPNVKRNKENGIFYYTFGEAKTLEEAIDLQKKLEEIGIKNSVIQKIAK